MEKQFKDDNRTETLLGSKIHKMFNFIKKSNLKYVNPDKADTSEKQKMQELKTLGQSIYTVQKNIFVEGFETMLPKGWQNSGVLTKYFWIQFKKTEYIEKPISISFFIEKKEKNFRIRVCLELKTKDIVLEDYEIYNKYQEEIQNKELKYLIGSNELAFKDNLKIFSSFKEAEKAIKNIKKIEYMKIQPSIILNEDEIDEKEDYMPWLKKSIQIIEPLYDNIMKKYDENKEKKIGKNENINDIKPIQKIYYGTPGTGKSYQVSKLIEKVHGGKINSEYVFRTTIYPDYSYFNFVGTIMPIKKTEEITYEFKPGIFTQALKKALDNPTVNVFLVLEEMSRGNIAAIFGDIFQLLDRDKNGRSDYEIKNDLISDVTKLDTVYLPSNLHIIGTVNTSDQNVNVIDTAFKRRFDFEYSTVEPVCDKDGKYLNSVNFKIGDNNYEWNQFYTTLNKFIINKLELSEDKQIGQFFIKFNEGMVEKEILPKIQNKLLHYLWEDVQGAALSPNYSIFKSECKRFLDVYKALEIGEEIFSKEFIEMYKGNNKDVDENNVEEESNELDDSE